MKVHQNTCKLCGKAFGAWADYRHCRSCRAMLFRYDIKLAENIKRSKENGKKTD
jgi:hypothetical protein